MDELHEAMEQLHREVAVTSAKKRCQARDRQAKSMAVQVQKYVIGDVQLAHPYELSLHHACRPKMYCEGGPDVTEDLADHIAFGNEGFHVAKLGDVRVENREYQALVYWLGLDEDEASWKPVRSLYEDIFIVFRRWVHQHEDQEEVKQMATELEKTLGHPL
ncbi:hypothetical protein DYB28_003759 [Aphanomyces astaci]|uniref:Chromo domain-containing protein n=1 Tax=Aphanomyces astaci TaxID=112090 RepID=A0A9X8E570_APHAT|nr:hypothetical protein DYB28_003759 [Aphanomyces astaci]